MKLEQGDLVKCISQYDDNINIVNKYAIVHELNGHNIYTCLFKDDICGNFYHDVLPDGHWWNIDASKLEKIDKNGNEDILYGFKDFL